MINPDGLLSCREKKHGFFSEHLATFDVTGYIAIHSLANQLTSQVLWKIKPELGR